VLTPAVKRDYPSFMTDEKPWQEQFEDDGITLGPEEALQREIQKSKSLKVERLKLKDQNEKLQYEVNRLKQENKVLKEKTDHPDATLKAVPSFGPATKAHQTAGWERPVIAILSILLAVAVLIIFIK
jgi:hypothetical protein